VSHHHLASANPPAGLSNVDSSLPNYIGTWLGPALSRGDIAKLIEATDLVLQLGPLKADYK